VRVRAARIHFGEHAPTAGYVPQLSACQPVLAPDLQCRAAPRRTKTPPPPLIVARDIAASSAPVITEGAVSERMTMTGLEVVLQPVLPHANNTIAQLGDWLKKGPEIGTETVHGWALRSRMSGWGAPSDNRLRLSSLLEFGGMKKKARCSGKAS